jgi:hypothetical protein
MQAFETSAVFDKKGKLIIEDMPLIKDKKVKLLFLIDEEDDSNEFYDLSIQGLSKAYSDDEPEYDFSMIKEPNALYKNKGK